LALFKKYITGEARILRAVRIGCNALQSDIDTDFDGKGYDSSDVVISTNVKNSLYDYD